jgi:hypothetical protein
MVPLAVEERADLRLPRQVLLLGAAESRNMSFVLMDNATPLAGATGVSPDLHRINSRPDLPGRFHKTGAGYRVRVSNLCTGRRKTTTQVGGSPRDASSRACHPQPRSPASARSAFSIAPGTGITLSLDCFTSANSANRASLFDRRERHGRCPTRPTGASSTTANLGLALGRAARVLWVLERSAQRPRHPHHRLLVARVIDVDRVPFGDGSQVDQRRGVGHAVPGRPPFLHKVLKRKLAGLGLEQKTGHAGLPCWAARDSSEGGLPPRQPTRTPVRTLSGPLSGLGRVAALW